MMSMMGPRTAWAKRAALLFTGGLHGSRIKRMPGPMQTRDPVVEHYEAGDNQENRPEAREFMEGDEVEGV